MLPRKTARHCTVIRAMLVLVVVAAGGRGDAEESWPTFQQNGQRNAYVPSSLRPESLTLSWTTRSPHTPRPAWHGPAKWDAYANLSGLHSMRNYDPVFHLIGDGDHVFFGSSVDHGVTCLDAASGNRLWSFFTNAPVRIPPTYHDGRLYFGSDDGYAYCLSAEDGELVWKFRPAEKDRWIVNNGNYIPLWPIRSGVVVDDGTAYFAASLLPWRTTYLCAVDAETGQVEGEGRFVQKHEELTLEGPLAIAQEILVVPQGRVPPVLFARQTGKLLGTLEGGGGAFVVIAGDEVLHGPGNKTGWLTRSSARSRDRLATHKHARAVIVVDETSYLLTRNSLIALDGDSQKPVWTMPCPQSFAMAGVGPCIFVGGHNEVRAYDRRDGAQRWRYPVLGRAHGLAFVAGRLLVSTDSGAMYSFQAGSQSVAAADTRKSSAELPSASATSASPSGQPNPAGPAAADPSLVGRWVFQKPHVHEHTALALAGELPASIVGPIQFERIGELQALVLDGAATSVIIASKHSSAELPQQALSAVAWVRVDEPLDQGEIIGVVKHGGDEGQGWVLGHHGSRFSLGLAGKDGAAGITELIATEDFQVSAWHHVAGTYDGRQMRLYVDGQLVANSDLQEGDIEYPEEAPYKIGTAQGSIHEARVYSRALTDEEVTAHYRVLAEQLRNSSPPDETDPTLVAAGPYLKFVGPHEAVVRWHTATEMPTRLTYRLDDIVSVVTDDRPKRDHEARLTGLLHNHAYSYWIDLIVANQRRSTQEYQCDTFFNYRVATDGQPLIGPTGDDSRDNLYAQAAADIIDQSGIQQGICLDIGMETGELARQLVQHSRLRVVGVVADADRANALRQELQESGLYGSRVVVLNFAAGEPWPLTSHSANLIVSEASVSSEDPAPLPSSDLLKLLAPGGQAVLGSRSATWTTWRAPPLDGAGEWSHAYGRADNSAYGGESLDGVSRREELVVQWLGRPGPRYQSDRNGRKPPPLSTGGRIYLQGLHRMVSLDAYNGTILWSLEIPHFERFNMPRDCSNWCADEEHVFTAIRDRCWIIDAATGDVTTMIPVHATGLTGGDYQWGYVASVDQLLLGSAAPVGASWTEFWGGLGWYDAESGEVTHRVCSHRLFALDKESGEVQWSYDRGVVINSTITAGGGHVSFVDCRHPAARADRSGRISAAELAGNQFLVTLDLQTGEVLWEQPLEPVSDDVAMTMAMGSGRLVLNVSSADDNSFHIAAYALADGAPAWNCVTPWGKNKRDHGTHLSRPAIVGDRLIVRPAVIDMQTGEIAPETMPISGCGTYACTDAALFFRAWSGQETAVWGLEEGNYSRWSRLRPDCWLSSIPAAGLLLAPEGGGGCSCGKWLETSLVFIPKSRVDAP